MIDSMVESTHLGTAESYATFECMRSNTASLEHRINENTSPYPAHIAAMFQDYGGIQTSLQSIAINFNTKSTQAESTVDQIKTIKDRLGLNRSQLAKALNVSRPQLNKWLEDQVNPQKESSYKRINILLNAIKKIPEEDGIYVGRLTKRYIDPDLSVMDILSDQHLSVAKVVNAYDAISGDIERLRVKQLSSNANSIHDTLPPPSY